MNSSDFLNGNQFFSSINFFGNHSGKFFGILFNELSIDFLIILLVIPLVKGYKVSNSGILSLSLILTR